MARPPHCPGTTKKCPGTDEISFLSYKCPETVLIPRILHKTLLAQYGLPYIDIFTQFYKNAPIGGEGGQGLPLRLTNSSKHYLKGYIRATSSKNCSSVGGRFIKGKNESFVLRECPVRPRSIKGKHVAGCICSASCTSANILHMYTLTHRYHRPRCQY